MIHCPSRLESWTSPDRALASSTSMASPHGMNMDAGLGTPWACDGNFSPPATSHVVRSASRGRSRTHSLICQLYREHVWKRNIRHVESVVYGAEVGAWAIVCVL